MDKISSIIQEAIGKTCIGVTDSLVDIWEEWFKGDVTTFHHYTIYNGKSHVKCKRKTLNMAKKVCEDWANLLFNEKTDISIEGENNQDNINRLFNDLKIWTKGNQGVEKSFALGMGAFVEGITNDKQPKLQFVARKKIYPITIIEDEITECAFVNINSNQVIIQIHYLVDGNYHIRTLYGEKDKQSDNITMFYGEPEKDIDFDTRSNKRWYQIFKPNIANNIDISSPLGISIYANALDIFEGVDLAYDGFTTEMALGKAKIFVDKELQKYTADGEEHPFDDNDITFYIYGYGDSNNNEPLKFYNPTLRTTDFFAGINNALNLLSAKVGFGENHYRFDGGGVTTATQVISENSEMFRTLKKHEILLNDVLIDMVKALMYICNEFGMVSTHLLILIMLILKLDLMTALLKIKKLKRQTIEVMLVLVL